MNLETPLVCTNEQNAIEGDRQWFEQNPGRSHRIRWLVEGELDLHARGICIVIQQVEPGIRLRIPIFVGEVNISLEECPEGVAAEIFNNALQGETIRETH